MFNKICVIGNKDSVLIFKAIGADVFTANDENEAKTLIHDLAKDNYAVIYITENLAEKISDTLDKYKTRPYPAIIPIPSASGSTGYGNEGIKKDMEKAIGADILFKGEKK